MSPNFSFPVKPFFVLAPMDDVTDTVFRQVISACAPPDLCFSEFTNVEGLLNSGRNRLLRKLERHPSEPPLIAHIWGLNPFDFAIIADQIASGSLADELGMDTNFKGIDINMGCPAKDITRMGACSGLIRNRDLAAAIIAATKKGARKRLPISVKTRLGYSDIEPEWTQFLLKQGIDMLSIHLRTVKELSLVEAHFEELTRIKKERDAIAPDTLLVANGDITSREQGEKLVEQYGIDGVMIGRGVFQDPFVFSKDSPWTELDPNAKLKLFIKHLQLYMQWTDQGDKGISRLNKYAKIYVNGFDGAKELRIKLATTKTIRQMLDYVEDCLTQIKKREFVEVKNF